MTFEGTVRVDILDEIKDTEKFNKFLSKYPRYLVYREIGKDTGKPHWQGVIFHQDEKEFLACKSRFSTMFSLTHDRSKKSMAKVKSENYKAYISKDGDLYASSGVAEEDILEWRQSSYHPIKDAGELAKKLTWVERVLEAFDKAVALRQVPDPLDEQGTEEIRWGTMQVARFVASQLGTLNKPFGDRLIVETTNLILQTRQEAIRPTPLKQWQEARENRWSQMLGL